ncbi:MAG: site-2 protease family protein [Candidatus Zambryskibacteria bacterium]|nr:site-2 protease family protein [Candidatus Zambryskibacteria bacterium]
MSIILFIIILAILIFVHELGHFLVAKAFGIRVDEFGLGFPPKLLSKKIGSTTYTLNAIPFGGFVKIFGEDPHAEEIRPEDRHTSFYYKPKIVQALVLVAGVTFNIIFACLLFIVGFMIGQPATPDTSRYGEIENPRLVITTVLPGSPAQKAGLVAGDAILFVEASGNKKGAQLDTEGNLTAERVTEVITESNGEKITLLYQRAGETPQTAFILPTDTIIPGKKAVGISMDTVGILKLSFPEAVLQGVITTAQLTQATAVGLGHFIWNAVTLKSDFSQVSGPVGVAGVVKEASVLGFVYVLSLTSLISINLAVINLVPFPALDGGRLLFVAIEAVTRRKIPSKFVTWVNASGFILLLVLMAAVTFSDIAKLF